MCRKYWIIALTLLFVISTVGIVQAVTYPFQEHEGYIITLTDIHNGVADKASQKLARFFSTLQPAPKHVFVGGDLTEMGTRYEYAKLKKNWEPVLGRIPFGWILGNHDARWSDTAYFLFEKELGPHYFAVDFGKFFFIGLNSSTLLEQHGHFGEAQVQWLKKKLAQIGRTKPVVIQAHHPFGGPSQFTDDGFKIFDAVKGYNVPLILVGHGHSWNVKGSYNHSWVQMLGAGMNENFAPISWDEDNLYLWQATVDGGAKSLRTIPFHKERVETMEWVSVPTYRNQTVSFFIETKGIKQVKAAFNGEVKTFELARDGVQTLKWTLKGEVKGKDLLRLEGVGESTTMLLTTEVTGNMSGLKWTFASGDSLFTKPALDGDLLYFGNEAGTFYAVKKGTGQKVWSYQTGAAILSSPAIVGDLVLFGSTDTHVYALDKTTGALVWKTALPGVIYGGVVVGKQSVAVGTGDFQIYALKPENGQILWKALGWGNIQSTGAFFDGKYIFTSWGGVIQVVDEITGKPVVTYPSGSGYETPAPSTPAVFQNRVIFTNTGNKYVGQSLLDKKDSWTVIDTSCGYSSVALDEQYGYLSTLKGEVFQFDPNTGKKLWTTTLPQAVYDSSPQVFRQHVVVGTTEGDIWILQRTDGKIIKHLSLGGGFIFGKILATDDTLYVGSMDGNLYAVDVSDL